MKINNFAMFPIFLILMCMFISNDAVKETVDYRSVNSDSKFIIDLIKRLGDPSYNYQSEDQEDSGSRAQVDDSPGKQQSHSQSEPQSASNELQNLQSTCEHVIQDGSIIQTTESINAGAVYIDSVRSVKSNADCLGYCCQNSTCDVAVYQDKGDRYCYLFNCAGHCIFRSHEGYFVSTIKGRKLPEHPEEDLQSLNTDLSASNNGEKKTVDDAAQKVPEKQEIVPRPTSELTTIKMATTTQTDPPELIITPHSVGLGGFCTLDGQCEDPNAVCGHGNCVCKNAFYNKEGICRKVCLQTEYECYELGTLVRGPECISRPQVCDSYLHCADGSDEFNCENTAHNYQQANWSRHSGPAVSSFKGNHKNSDSADTYTPPVAQEPADDNQQKKTASQLNNPQDRVFKEHEMGSHQQADVSPLQNYDVRLKPTIASKDGSMPLNQNLYSDNVQYLTPKPNPYLNTGNFPDNQNLNVAHAANTNTNPGSKGLVNNEHYSSSAESKNMNPASVQQLDGLRQENAAKLEGKPNSDSQFSAQSQTYETGPLHKSDSNNNGQNLQKHVHQHPTGFVDAGQKNPHPSQFMENHSINSQPIPQTAQVSNQESGLRSSSKLHSENNGNNFQQNSRHADKSSSLAQKISASSSIKSSKATNPHPQNSGNAPNKSKSKVQTSIKSHSSPFDRSSSESQNRMSMPRYSNSQKWLDPNIYVPYNLGDSQSQQEQPQAPVGNHYFDASQYYPPYSSDSLDPLPESLLENAGSNDEFSQFGGPDIGHGRSMGLPYNSQNSGYQGYPESPYGAQYPPSIRYDDSADYRSPVYQDPDLYSSVGNQRAYQPSAGLYEDFPSGLRPPKLSNLHKSQDSKPPSTGQKKIDEVISPHGESTKAAKTDSHATKLPPVAASNNKIDSATTPTPVTHKLFPESHGDKKHIFMSSEKVIIANTSDAEGPIIALSLGLAFTVILLVLVGCRLRNVRHRLRKGRPLHQNEADYLINGMYL